MEMEKNEKDREGHRREIEWGIEEEDRRKDREEWKRERENGEKTDIIYRGDIRERDREEMAS